MQSRIVNCLFLAIRQEELILQNDNKKAKIIRNNANAVRRKHSYRTIKHKLHPNWSTGGLSTTTCSELTTAPKWQRNSMNAIVSTSNKHMALHSQSHHYRTHLETVDAVMRPLQSSTMKTLHCYMHTKQQSYYCKNARNNKHHCPTHSPYQQ